MRRKKAPANSTSLVAKFSPSKRLQEVVQKRCANQFKDRCKLVTEILDDKESTNATKLRALDLLGKYGGLLHADPTIQVAYSRNIAQDLAKELLDQIEAFLAQQTARCQSMETISIQTTIIEQERANK
jgi:hypothetical protein